MSNLIAIDGHLVPVVDVNITPPKIDYLWYLGVNGAVTVKGYFIDAYGRRAKAANGTPYPSFTGTINGPGGTPKNWAQIAGMPTNSVYDTLQHARGVKVILSGDVREDVNDTGAADSDFTNNYVNYPIHVAVANGYNVFGRALAQPSSTSGQSSLSNNQAVGQGLTYFSNFGTGAAAQVATGARKIKKIRARNGTNSLLYFQIFDRNTAPVSGTTVPYISIPVGIGVANSLTTETLDPQPDWYAVNNGIYVAWSSTPSVYTAVTPAVQHFGIDYV